MRAAAEGHTVVAIPLAAGVFAWAGLTLSPAVGAILMSLSTIVVALNAQTLRRLDLTPGPSPLPTPPDRADHGHGRPLPVAAREM